MTLTDAFPPGRRSPGPAPAARPPDFGDGFLRGVGGPVTKDGQPKIWRLGIVLAGVGVAQALVAPRLGSPGAAPDLLLLATVAVAAAVPARLAVIFGFAAGLAADLLLITPFGLSAAAFTAIARAGAALPAPRRALFLAPRTTASAVLAGGLVMFGAAAFGESPVPSSTSLGLLLRASVTAGALSPPVFAALRRLAGAGRPA